MMNYYSKFLFAHLLLLFTTAVHSFVSPSIPRKFQVHNRFANLNYNHHFAVKDVNIDFDKKGIDDKALSDVIGKVLDKDDNRNVPLLQQWAIEQGVQIADGVEFVDNGLGDWGVGLNQSHTEGTSVMTIPSDLILSSKAEELQMFRNDLLESMNRAGGMEFFVPECMLILRVLEEKSKGPSSRWQPWLNTLPKYFNTGLYFDKLERSQAERLAPEFVRQQNLQWNACYSAIKELLERGLLSEHLATYLRRIDNDNNDNDNDNNGEENQSMESLIRWAFSVVFTRSWRTASGSEATLVPLGDMFNHDSQNANVAPQAFSDDGSIKLSLKEDVDAGTSLFITYGLSNFPGRFLILFGFWDRSSPYMDANLTIPEEFPADRSQLVVSTRSGAIAEDVWNLAVYNVLSQRDPEGAARMVEAQLSQDEDTLQELCSKWNLEAALYLRLHVLKLLGETYPDMDLVPENMSESPIRYGMIARYNNGIRDSWMNVANYLEEEIDRELDKREAGIKT